MLGGIVEFFRNDVLVPVKTSADRVRRYLFWGLFVVVVVAEYFMLSNNYLVGGAITFVGVLLVCLLLRKLVRPRYDQETKQHVQEILRLKRGE